MKRILLATVAVLAATVAQAEPIIMAPNSAKQISTERPFKIAVSGDEELLTVHPGATDRDLTIVASQPDGEHIAEANVLLIDDQGKLVKNLRVTVTPFNAAPETVRFVRGTQTTTYLCTDDRCVNASAAKSRKKGMGDADSMTVTSNKDGSTLTTKQWLTK